MREARRFDSNLNSRRSENGTVETFVVERGVVSRRDVLFPSEASPESFHVREFEDSGGDRRFWHGNQQKGHTGRHTLQHDQGLRKLRPRGRESREGRDAGSLSFVFGFEREGPERIATPYLFQHGGSLRFEEIAGKSVRRVQVQKQRDHVQRSRGRVRLQRYHPRFGHPRGEHLHSFVLFGVAPEKIDQSPHPRLHELQNPKLQRGEGFAQRREKMSAFSSRLRVGREKNRLAKF